MKMMRPVHPSPSQGPLAIGAKLRATRTAQGLTMANISEATGLTKGFISRIERDETSPSVATLVTICEVLSLPLGSLFESPENEVITLKDAPLINMGGSKAVEKLLTPRSESRVQVLRSTLSPGATGGAELYTINCDAEVAHVLSGELTIVLTTGDVVLHAGDSMTIAGREPHTWFNRSPGTTEVMWIIVPAAWSGSS
jgi:transcriptional regulator with XRE-family HTH domain